MNDRVEDLNELMQEVENNKKELSNNRKELLETLVENVKRASNILNGLIQERDMLLKDEERDN